MRWVLQLVETGNDSGARSVQVLEISRPNDLGDIANLGLTLPEAKQLLARVQQAVVAAQARDHAILRPDCSACGGGCHVKDWRLRQVATLFGGLGAARLGVADMLRERIAKTGFTGDESRAIVKNAWTREQLRPIVKSEEEFNKFVEAVMFERLDATLEQLLGITDDRGWFSAYHQAIIL